LNKQEDSAVEVAVLRLVTHFLTKIRLSSTNLYSRYSKYDIFRTVSRTSGCTYDRKG